eukprot:CAMPEP_0194049384 /NCGR_PEP_ID=MMETSP0009_2-20130614/30568_1 /TAXON_ID=210454 /ORGANISM="Grammatophora oceanica, Strain CCMP 410" /LENGTH=313 /DNA_ID=CAMNT_0038695525 /DNA_START=231 /DNA_END=1172 /DNA_ORIENTATION=+
MATARVEETIGELQGIIGTDAGGRGMKALICPGDLVEAAKVFGADLSPSSSVLVLSGFPCMVDHTPPTETDGPPGAVCLCRAAIALGHSATLVTDECNADVFEAALEGTPATLEVFSSELSAEDEERLQALKDGASLVIALERSGPAKDGNCYTMRGINMTERGLIAPIHKIVQGGGRVPFIAIGDGGNELGMGKMLEAIEAKIPKGELIGCAIAADHLIAASVSNWGGWALSAAAALARAEKDASLSKKEWVEKCIPTEAQEVALLERCVEKGCRDGSSGKMEATVDGLPLERSLQCLRDIRAAALGATATN